ncbi:hypothetical protein [Aeromonas veronii]|uniref:hypothetical protein n=1 Tax=Aeromonas veronii TaxID=654 RepID=UPI001D06D7AA|nr:hypothetical protein [Aeromonas veronii]
MKSLIATLIVSVLSLNVMANENPRPELDELESAQLEQDVQSELQQASHTVVQDALHNLKPLALDTLVVEASQAVATHPES